jgi:hypothetical protein
VQVELGLGGVAHLDVDVAKNEIACVAICHRLRDIGHYGYEAMGSRPGDIGGRVDAAASYFDTVLQPQTEALLIGSLVLFFAGSATYESHARV